MNRRGNLFVITAPSGAGKGTIISKLLTMDENICLSISATTRKPREMEIDGVHYNFISKEQFEQKIKEDSLLEYAKYNDNYYGTPLEFLDIKRNEGKDVILEIEVIGAKNVREKCPEAYQIFITPPSFEELERRLVGRGTEDIETIRNRLEIAKIELLDKDKFDKIVVNDDLETACNEIIKIIKSKRV